MANVIPKPKPPAPPPPPPNTATAADASVVEAGDKAARGGYSSMVSTSATGLQRKATTAKTTLIGGA